MIRAKNSTMSFSAIRSALLHSFDNVVLRERSFCDSFVLLNPAHAEERQNDRDLVLCGINSLYYEFLRELERIEKI